MINKLLAAFAFICTVAAYFLKLGKDNEKNRTNKATLDGVKETKKIKSDIAKLSRADKLKQL